MASDPSAAQDQETPGREAERMVDTARAMVTAYDGMLGVSFWIEYGALKSEIEEFERTWANVQP
jgi:hypothetical protein